MLVDVQTLPLDLLADTQPQHKIDHLEGDPGDDSRPEQHRADTPALADEL